MPDDNGRRTTGDYAKKLFHNVYNYTLLGGVATAAVATGQWWFGLIGVGVEALYMLYAPDSETIRRAVDNALTRDETEERLRRRKLKLVELGEDERARAQALSEKQDEIKSLAAQNPSLTGELLAKELDKTDRLLDAFIELSLGTVRSERYLQKEDLDQIESEARGYGERADKDDLAKKNFAILSRRLERLREIKEFCGRASGQLDLIENSLGSSPIKSSRCAHPEKWPGSSTISSTASKLCARRRAKPNSSCNAHRTEPWP